MSIYVDSSEVLIGLDRLLGRLNDSALYARVGVYEKNAVKERIRTTKTNAEGEDWAELSPITERIRNTRGTLSKGALWDSGKLLGSIRARIVGVGAESVVEVGSNLRSEYPAYLQEGTNHMVAREFLGWSKEDYLAVSEIITSHMEGR